MANFDDMKLAVEALTGGKNTVILDDMDMPSVMVRWEKQLVSDIMTGGSSQVHPGSIVNNVAKTMYVGKYQGVVMNDRAYSLPFQDPRTYITHDQAVAACRNKKTTGGAWNIMPYALWSEIALWCRKNGTMPRGNNNYGADISYAHEKGTPSCALDGNGRVLRTATGSGPATWNHNWLPDGIADMNGNVWEWCTGMRLVDGEIQIIPNANVMDPEVSLAANSSAWRAINASGQLVNPGSANTLHYDWTGGKITLTAGAVTPTDAGRYTDFNALGAASGLTVPELAKALLIYPDTPGGDYGGDGHWMNNAGERLPICGGTWGDAAHAGVFSVSLNAPRSHSDGYIGFRPAFCEL